MKLSPYIFFLILFLSLYPFLGKSQEFSLSYEEIDGVPVVPVKIAGTTHYFIFDTGTAETTVDKTTFSNLLAGREIGVLKMNNRLSSPQITNLKDFSIGNLEFKQWRVILVDLNQLGLSDCNGRIEGILGRDIMKNFVVEIKPGEQKINFYSPQDFSYKNMKQFKPVSFSDKSRPLLVFKIDNESNYFLFDTGNKEGLSLRYKDRISKKLRAAHSYLTIHSIEHDHSSLPKEPETQYLFDNLTLTFPNWTLKNQRVLLTEKKTNTAGFSFIKDFQIFLDFPEHKVYLKPYSDSINPTPSFLQKFAFDYSFNTKSGKNEITRIIPEKTPLKLRDQLLELEGEPLPLSPCKAPDFKTQLRQKIQNDTVQLRFKRAKKTSEINIQLLQ